MSLRGKRGFVNRNMMSTRDAILSLSPFGPRRDMNLFDVYQQMNTREGLFAEGLTGTNLNMDRAKATFDKLEDLGIDVTQDIGPQLDKVSTTDFRKAFGLIEFFMNKRHRLDSLLDIIQVYFKIRIGLIAELETDHA